MLSQPDTLSLVFEDRGHAQAQTTLYVRPDATDHQVQALVDAVAALSEMALRQWRWSRRLGGSKTVEVLGTKPGAGPYAFARMRLHLSFRAEGRSSTRFTVAGPVATLGRPIRATDPPIARLIEVMVAAATNSLGSPITDFKDGYSATEPASARRKPPRYYKPRDQGAADAEAMTVVTERRPRTTIPEDLRVAVLARDGHRCRLCGAPEQRDVKLHVLYVQPVARSGEVTLENLQTLCPACKLYAQRASRTRPASGAAGKKKKPGKPGDSVPLSLRYAVLARDNKRCRRCSASSDDGAKMDVVHVVPPTRGGPTTRDNLQVVCTNCRAEQDDQVATKE